MYILKEGKLCANEVVIKVCLGFNKVIEEENILIQQ